MQHNEVAQRAKDHLPAVLLTLLSIVQALALELLWGHIMETQALYQLSFISVLSWLQVLTTLFGIFLIWLIYSSIVMRFRWVPSTRDSLLPFVVGLVEFALIANLGPQSLGPWFVILAVTFALVAWIGQVTMRRARLDGENEEYFRDIAPATWRDHLPALATVCLLLLLGGTFWLSSHQGWFAMLAVSIALAVLLVQLWLSDVFWQRSVGETDSMSNN